MSTRSTGGMGSAGMMLLSAAIFGFFGFFYISWTPPGNVQRVFFSVLLEWTLKATAIGFALSAALTFVRPYVGRALYGIIGVLSAVAFVVVALLDLIDTKNTIMPYGWVVLILFALWNGFGAVNGLRELATIRPDEDEGMIIS